MASLQSKPRSNFPLLAIACLCTALPAGAQSFRSAFASGYDGWTADFADYAATDSSKRILRHGIGEIPSISPAMTALRMLGAATDTRSSDSTGDLFPFIRKRFTGLSPNAEYLVVIKAELATAYGQFSRDTIWIKVGVTTLEPRKTASAGGMYRMNIAKGLPRRPGADMDTLGRIGYSGGGHAFPESRVLGNAHRPLRVRADGSGAAWICFGADFLPSTGSPGIEFNIGTLQVEFAAAASSLRPRGKPDPATWPGLRAGIFHAGSRAWNLAGERIQAGAGPAR